ncbi:predicted protein [Chaetoceros tenuissimus]|uniref:Uncharacterized protein n=1 Tax=Chaetoceros tenuissimus TaxID=426638 RepID=A0AAD3DCJ2_9STRA|nr:predicted protein [Chaetoceros tenuissimus]
MTFCARKAKERFFAICKRCSISFQINTQVHNNPQSLLYCCSLDILVSTKFTDTSGTKSTIMNHHNHPYYAASPGRATGGYGYHSTPTISNGLNLNGDASITSSIAHSLSSTVASDKETIISVTLGKTVQNGTLQTNTYEGALQQLNEAYIDNSLGSSPSFETSVKLDHDFIEYFQSEYLNDLGQTKISLCRGYNDQGGEKYRMTMRVRLDDDVNKYVQQLQAFGNECLALKQKNEEILPQFANISNLELRAMAEKRMEEVSALSIKVRRMITALKKFGEWLDHTMGGRHPEHQETLLVVQEILNSFTYSGNVTVYSTLQEVLKGELEVFSNSLDAVANGDLQEFPEALVQGIYDTFSKIRDNNLEDDTKHAYFYLLYEELYEHRKSRLAVLIEKMLEKAKERGLIHRNVKLYRIDGRNRITGYQWCKYFLLVVFGCYQELGGILAEESVDGKKAVLAYLEEAKKGNWIVFVDAQDQAADEDMDSDL